MPSATEVMPIDEIKNKLAPLFAGEGLRLALLFVSAATGKTHKRSDIDLAFLFDTKKLRDAQAVSIENFLKSRGFS